MAPSCLGATLHHRCGNTLIEKLLMIDDLEMLELIVVVACGILLMMAVTVLKEPIAHARKLWLERGIRRVPRATIGQLERGGLARVAGEIASIPAPLQAPLSGRECAYYKVVVEEWFDSGDDSPTSRRVLVEERGENFCLQDETGQILVQMKGARVSARPDANDESDEFNEPSPQLEALLARHRKKSTNFLGLNKSLRYQESILTYGKTITAAGVVLRSGDKKVLGSSEKIPLRVSDMPTAP